MPLPATQRWRLRAAEVLRPNSFCDGWPSNLDKVPDPAGGLAPLDYPDLNNPGRRRGRKHSR